MLQETLNKIGLNRINFAFLDAQHTKNAVLEEFKYINKRQIKGYDFFDDVTPNVFDGVCEAVKGKVLIILMRVNIFLLIKIEVCVATRI